MNFRGPVFISNIMGMIDSREKLIMKVHPKYVKGWVVNANLPIAFLFADALMMASADVGFGRSWVTFV